MPHMRDFLSRFRPAGAPGAGPAAVPADRRRELESELGPVLMLLDAPSVECSGIVAAAERDAAQILQAARREADDIRAAGQQQAEARVAELVAAAASAASSEAAAIAADGAAASAAIAQRALRRLPVLTERAVAVVRDLAGADGAS